MTGGLALVWPVIAAAFLASLVGAVEALTIVLAVTSFAAGIQRVLVRSPALQCWP
jgi:uncharacterized membrane protein